MPQKTPNPQKGAEIGGFVIRVSLPRRRLRNLLPVLSLRLFRSVPFCFTP